MSSFKNLAKRAKNRLTSASEGTNKTVSIALGAKSTYYVVSSMGMSAKDDPLYTKVKKMLETNKDLINPIGKLIDHSVFDGLSQTEKDRYLIDLSKRYQRIKKALTL